jgi:hypothetical protein
MAASLFKWLIAGIWLSWADPSSTQGIQVMSGKVVPDGRMEWKHPLYISVTEINHNLKDKTLEISCKMFTNDLESVLEKLSHNKVDLSDAAGKQSTDKLINDYIVRHLQLKVDGHPVVLQWVGSEKEADGTWSYFQVSNVASLKKIDINNSLLYDAFDKEINIMHVSVGGVKKSTRLDYPAVNAVIEF